VGKPARAAGNDTDLTRKQREEARRLAKDLQIVLLIRTFAKLGEPGRTLLVGSRPGGRRFESDGPLSEQDVQIAGFNILECADLDEALGVASKNPGVNFGILELRPIKS